MLSVGWLVSFLVFLGLELAFGCLTSLWFAAGAIGGFAAALAGLPMEAQLAVFVAVSFMLFLMVRPFAYKYLYSKRTNTNVDSLTGRKAVVKERIDNVAGTGTAILAGETWLARAAQEGDTFEAGDVVIISAVSGAKLLVAAAKQEHEVEKV